MNLHAASLRWAIKHILEEGDTDLLPIPFEFAVIRNQWAVFQRRAELIQIEGHVWSGTRRFVAPKAEFSFRSVCQLEPIDSILFAAPIRQIGAQIERKRVSTDKERVFSNRFRPKQNGQMYSHQRSWEGFWSRSCTLASLHSHVLMTDITDFYNQIYHHAVENELAVCGMPKDVIHTIKNFLVDRR